MNTSNRDQRFNLRLPLSEPSHQAALRNRFFLVLVSPLRRDIKVKFRVKKLEIKERKNKHGRIKAFQSTRQCGKQRKLYS